jgi:putative copper resistance protein D
MSWFGAEIDGPMVVTRMIQFAAAASAAGALIFRGLVAGPALRGAPSAAPLVDKQVHAVAWLGLAVTVVSGLTWVLLLTMSLSDESLGEAVMSGALRDVLNLTQFGLVSQVRLALAIVLAICLTFEGSALGRRLALAAAVCLIASIAWTGHAASTPYQWGYLHLASDALHGAAFDFGGWSAYPSITALSINPGTDVTGHIRTWRRIPAPPLELPRIKLRQPSEPSPG